VVARAIGGKKGKKIVPVVVMAVAALLWLWLRRMQASLAIVPFLFFVLCPRIVASRSINEYTSTRN